jgi:ribosomal protein L40E
LDAPKGAELEQEPQQTRSSSIRCAACGGLNPPGAQWCGQCLARFTRPEPPPPPPTTRPVSSAPLSEAEGDPPFGPDPLASAQVIPAQIASDPFGPAQTGSVPPGPRASADPTPRLHVVVDTENGARSSANAVFNPANLPRSQEGAGRIVERGAFRAAGDHITWTCTVCDEENPLEAAVCTICGSPFAVTVRPKEPEGPIRDPNNAALISLFFPGAGHAYIGMWGQAIARGVMSLWIAATALVAAITKGPNSGSLALTFGLASFVLWLIASHDAYRDARREPALVILKGRRFLWLTLALLGVMFLTLMVGALGARTGTSL